MIEMDDHQREKMRNFVKAKFNLLTRYEAPPSVPHGLFHMNGHGHHQAARQIKPSQHYKPIKLRAQYGPMKLQLIKPDEDGSEEYRPVEPPYPLVDGSADYPYPPPPPPPPIELVEKHNPYPRPKKLQRSRRHYTSHATSDAGHAQILSSNPWSRKSQMHKSYPYSRKSYSLKEDIYPPWQKQQLFHLFDDIQKDSKKSMEEKPQPKEREKPKPSQKSIWRSIPNRFNSRKSSMAKPHFRKHFRKFHPRSSRKSHEPRTRRYNSYDWRAATYKIPRKGLVN